MIGFQKTPYGLVLLASLGALVWHGACAAPDGTSKLRSKDAHVGGSGVGGSGFGGDGFGVGGKTSNANPVTCAEAADARSYIGCEFWPTITANAVWSIFDFAVVIANAGDGPVDAHIDRGEKNVASVTVAPGSLETIYLPWINELKGPEATECGSSMASTNSGKMPAAAYHLSTSAPVTVYQFSPLEYAPKGGPTGKDWSSCPGSQPCHPVPGQPQIVQPPVGCFSFSNDATLLLPTTALTGNYRVTGWASPGSFAAITGTEDGTAVTVKLSNTGQVVAGGTIAATSAGGTLTFTVDRGEVVQLLSGLLSNDLSGSLVTADKPVQVITGVPCATIPDGAAACDHLEESVFPAETLGQHYFVTQPAGPTQAVVQHAVRIYGNVDGTVLTYPAGKPAATTPAAVAPDMINAGEVADLGLIGQDFEIVGSAAFAVGTFMLGGSIVDPNADPTAARGDPAQSFATAVEQYRTRYIFLAPVDYDVNFVFVVMPMTAKLTLDKQAVATMPIQIGKSGFGTVRLVLKNSGGGAHELTSTDPVGIQVGGYGSFTSFFYPGGSDLVRIAPPPPK